eukprot:COSAG02_NODE_59350_length_274_cov_1.034286_1_plen_68_part_10
MIVPLYAEHYSTKIFYDESSGFPHSHFMSVVLSCLARIVYYMDRGWERDGVMADVKAKGKWRSYDASL